MICPCHNCLVYIRCKHRIEKHDWHNKDVFYTFDDLIKECGELRKFFGLDSLVNRAKIRKYRSSSYFYEQTMMGYIDRQPHGKQLLETFLKVMRIDILPTTLNPKIRLKSGGI